MAKKKGSVTLPSETVKELKAMLAQAGGPVKASMAVVDDDETPISAKAEHLALQITEHGLDYMPLLTELLKNRADLKELKVVEKQLRQAAGLEEGEEEEIDTSPRTTETYLETIPLVTAQATNALLLATGKGLVILPVADKTLKNLGPIERGEPVFLSQMGSIEQHPNVQHFPGDILLVEEVMPKVEGELPQVVVQIGGTNTMVYLSRKASDQHVEVGSRVLVDTARKVAHEVIPAPDKGDDLLTPVSELSDFTVESLGSPNPVIDRILKQIRRMVEHPDWVQKMQVRERASYLWHGPTGTGKTAHIKALVNAVADHVEELTGVRDPRVVFCDASQFYSPFFGESEQRINSFFQKLGKLSGKTLLGKDGQEVAVPLIVVFEELEGLVRQRGSQDSSSHLFDRTLSLVLQKMDEASSNLDHPMLVISTTNMKSRIDTAARRRFAQREAYFGTLGAEGALSVLEKKIPEGMPIHKGPGQNYGEAREALLKSTLYYLFSGQSQPIAKIETLEGDTHTLHRKEVITGALLEMAVSEAIDSVLEDSEDEGNLIGMTEYHINSAVQKQIENFASSLDRHNITEYAGHILGEVADGFVASVTNLCD